MIRFLFWGLLIYLGFKLIGRLLGGGHKQHTNVTGDASPKGSIDLSQHDVEDADYEDIK